MKSTLVNNVKDAYLKLQELQSSPESCDEKLIYRCQRQIINNYCEYLYITRGKNAYWNHYKWGNHHPAEEVNIAVKDLGL